MVAVLVAAALIACEFPAAAEPSPRGDGAPAVNSGHKEFKDAGACARCHVVSVLEWGTSGHRRVGTTCQSCHGRSDGHVANERNEIKPQRLPRGANIAGQLCLTCHQKSCPKTKQTQTCQQCHDVHALVHPSSRSTKLGTSTNDSLQIWRDFNTHMARGRQHVKKGQWPAAHAAFQAALTLLPGDRRARMQSDMCLRRIDPAIPGFRIIGDAVEPVTGLPRDVEVPQFKIRMGLVPPGEFDMGSDAFADSRPVHTVRVEPFYLGRFEITQAQWRAVMDENPASHQGEPFGDSATLPVERVSWNDSLRFIERLNGRVSGDEFRLPTEAEWEYACRSGTDLPFEPDGAGASSWFRTNSLRQVEPQRELLELEAYAPRPVGTRQPNRWGFFDMQGNVGEWCSSLWRPYVYDRHDGRESIVSPGLRVVRGGHYADSSAGLDPTLRHAERPDRRLRFHGLRLARAIPPPASPGVSATLR